MAKLLLKNCDLLFEFGTALSSGKINKRISVYSSIHRYINLEMIYISLGIFQTRGIIMAMNTTIDV